MLGAQSYHQIYVRCDNGMVLELSDLGGTGATMRDVTCCCCCCCCWLLLVVVVVVVLNKV